MLQWLNIESGIYVQHTWFMRKEEAGVCGGVDKVESGNIEAAMRETSQEELVLIIIIFL